MPKAKRRKVAAVAAAATAAAAGGGLHRTVSLSGGSLGRLGSALERNESLGTLLGRTDSILASLPDPVLSNYGEGELAHLAKSIASNAEDDLDRCDSLLDPSRWPEPQPKFVSSMQPSLCFPPRSCSPTPPPLLPSPTASATAAA